MTALRTARPRAQGHALRRGRMRAAAALLALAAALPLLAASRASAFEALPGAPPMDPALRARIERSVAERAFPARTRQRDAAGRPRFANRLALEASPYLLQHAHNPVDWRPWGEAAFARARELDRPVFVSIGYATCHWCHVMEEESFDDPEVAAFLNAHFVPVKVDREARPDVDAIYMAAVSAMGIRGGWPLNVWLTPERRPFFGGTYFPPRDAANRPGFLRVLRGIAAGWAGDRARIVRHASAVTEAVRAALEPAAPQHTPVLGPEALEQALAHFDRVGDRTWGGVGLGLKFPSSLPVRLLLRAEAGPGAGQRRALAVTTLERMAAGGIRDHLGGGFHRYATDREWHVPHFEKMLYDNALLALAYLEGWQHTGRSDFADVADEIATYLLRELRAPGGGFWSATDADSAGPDGELEEGRFFTWTAAELAAALPAAQARALAAWYGVGDAGDLDGRDVLHRSRPAPEVARELGLAPDALAARVAAGRARLLELRATRPPPLLDDKILTGWNGLAISALARVGFARGRDDFVAAARDAAEHLLGSLRRDGRLLRGRAGDRPLGPAFLEDHAFAIAGLLDLYEADPDPRWLRAALALQRSQERHHAAPGGGYYRSAADHDALLGREQPLRDGAVPSGNSVAAANLLRLYHWTVDPAWDARLNALLAGLAPVLHERPHEVPELLLALQSRLRAMHEVALVVPPGADPAALLEPLRRRPAGGQVLARARVGDDLEAHAALVPWLAGKRALGGQPTAYVCIERVCERPTRDPAELARQLARPTAPEAAR